MTDYHLFAFTPDDEAEIQALEIENEAATIGEEVNRTLGGVFAVMDRLEEMKVWTRDQWNEFLKQKQLEND